MKPKSKILIIAGSDSSGGAGIQADIKTVTSLGSYAMTAVTAVTSQNTTGVNSIVSLPTKEIEKQIIFTNDHMKIFRENCYSKTSHQQQIKMKNFVPDFSIKSMNMLFW